MDDYVGQDSPVRVIDVFIDDLDISRLGLKSIADFRKDKGDAVRLDCRELAMLCRKLNLLTDMLVALKGSKIKAVNNRDKNDSDQDEAMVIGC